MRIETHRSSRAKAVRTVANVAAAVFLSTMALAAATGPAINPALAAAVA